MGTLHRALASGRRGQRQQVERGRRAGVSDGGPALWSVSNRKAAPAAGRLSAFVRSRRKLSCCRMAGPRVAACNRGTLPHMGSWVGRVVRVRTSSDGAGEAYDLVMGVGASPERALAGLRSEAEARVARMAEVSVKPAGGTAAGSSPPAHSSSGQGSGGGERRLGATPLGRQPQSGGSVSSRPPERRFEVVGVRLAAGVLEGGESGWLAYGTLALEGGSKPGAGGTRFPNRGNRFDPGDPAPF